MEGNEFLLEIVDLVKKNQLDEARPLVRDYVRFYAGDVRGWTILARITDDKEEKVTALERILELKPDDPWAKQTWDKMLGEERIREAVAKAKVGQIGEAGELVESVLKDNPDNPGAWMLKARLTKDREEAIHALKEVLRINPKNQQAKDRLARLTTGKVSAGKEEKEKKGKKNKIVLFGIPAVLILGILCVAFVLPLFGVDALPGNLGDLFSGDSKMSMANCQALVERALETTNQNCQTLGSYEICYGNYDIDAVLLPGSTGSFDVAGDTLSVEVLEKFTTAPLDLEKEVWGVALFKVPGEVEGTLPGQNVTFIVFGDTSLDPTSSDMKSFYFTSGITGVTCAGVGFEGMEIETPEGVTITLNINGVDISIEGKAKIMAPADGDMEVQPIQGPVKVTVGDDTVEANPGDKVMIPLAGGDDRAPEGPMDLVPLSEEDKAAICATSGEFCPDEGEVTAITAVTSDMTEILTITETPPTLSLTPPPGSFSETPTPELSFTWTPTITLPPTYTPTVISIPPSDTPTPTPTTPPPPPSQCSLITFDSISTDASSNEMWFNITNNTGGAIVVTEVTLSWPFVDNGNLLGIKLKGNDVYAVEVGPSPVTISGSDWKTGVGSRKIGDGATNEIRFWFQITAAGTGYTVTVTFDIGCPTTISN